MAALPHVFAPGAIGPLQLPHRVVMGSMHLGLEGADDDGRALAAFYAERARAGAALIVTGGSAVSRVGSAGRNYSFVNEPGDASKLARVADAVHAADGQILLQLFHAGRYAIPSAFDLQPVAPSAVYAALVRAEPRELSDAEVRGTIADFARGAQRAVELGFDGVEIMGSEGYLLNQFAAAVTNLRDDDWGGDAERRMAFPLAVADAVRDAAGATAAVVYRISGADLVPGGASAEEVMELSARLADAKVDALNVGIGWHEARVPTVQLHVPHGAWAPWARDLRARVGVPVIASNRINSLAFADDLLARGDADFVSLARPFLADPEIVAKARSVPGRPVNVCIACDQACIDRSLFDQRVSCVVNPRAGFELELEPIEVQARVAVVGGGPAGMEAARALAAAGAAVTLFEASRRLGGQFRMACRIPGKEDYAGTIAYFEAELARLEVDVRLGASATLGDLGGFDGVVVATGVTPRPVQIAGAGLRHVHTYADLLDPDTPEIEIGPAHPVAIIGAGGIGLDVAHLLSHAGPADPLDAFYVRYGLRGASAAPDGFASPRPVTLMRRSGRIGQGVGPTTRWVTSGELTRAGVETLTGIDYVAIEPGVLRIRRPSGATREIAADTVIVCAGQLCNDALSTSLAAAGVVHLVIGGAAQAGELDAERAFRDGAQAPARLLRLIGSRP
jgi:2,4-dienoyl-CoA reductase (NADPH2)